MTIGCSVFPSGPFISRILGTVRRRIGAGDGLARLVEVSIV